MDTNRAFRRGCTIRGYMYLKRSSENLELLINGKASIKLYYHRTATHTGFVKQVSNLGLSFISEIFDTIPLLLTEETNKQTGGLLKHERLREVAIIIL